LTTLHPLYRQWIEASPFAVLTTVGPGGLDASPRGDVAPLVRIVDDHTLLLPERRGNNRIDGLRSMLSDPRAALIFFVPGVNETVRVNGRASITVEPVLMRSFAVEGAEPTCVVEVRVDTVFFQCGRALIRSGLWNHAPGHRPEALPSACMIPGALSAAAIDGEADDRELPQCLRGSLH
jgi:PPOX class probable FMN-dependent enzyme